MNEVTEQPRYSIGIDLGTTHCVVSYVDNHSDTLSPTHDIFPIQQLVSPGNVEALDQLPSFFYQPHPDEFIASDLALPWSDKAALVGKMARELGVKTPLRLVSSAKSWLCQPGVNGRTPILPLESPEEVEKVSPFTAAVHYLEHMQAAWNNEHPEDLLADQDVVLTIPASFDPAARELTAEAAKAIGIQQLTLLEEPQAAVYHWVQAHGKAWREQLAVNDVILVVDIGGGTTDLSLVSVTEEAGSLSLSRIAVGDHILLGGDNMDLALAYAVKAKLAQEGKTLQAWQLQGLTHGCRQAKEQLLSDDSIDAVPLVVPSRGSKLIGGGTLRTELTRAELESSLIEGFFPECPVDTQPQQARRGALQKQGLSYAADAGITRHIAAFLSKQAGASSEHAEVGSGADFLMPTAVLFNGGTLKSPLLANRLLSILSGWVEQAGGNALRLLDGADVDLAVAKGAAYFGNVRRGQGVRIKGGVASSYYVGIESAMPAIPGFEPPIQALCVAPFGMEEGAAVEMSEAEFGLVVGEPVQFRFFGSNTRREDAVGTLLEDWPEGELEELPAIEATIPVDAGRQAGETVPVQLSAHVTEIGTLELEARPVEGGDAWQVSFDVRQY